MQNTLFTNDNLFILNGLNNEIADLIYLDPPFNSKRTYSAPIGTKSAGASFKDMWTWQDVDEAYLDKLIEKYPALVDFINSIEATHSKAMKAYITYITQRMIELHRVLKETGSIYLHCDPTASHYLKQMMDCIFGKDNFRNEIVWSYQGTGEPKKHFKRKHDVILFYCKDKGKLFFDNDGSSEEVSEFSKSKYTKEDSGGKYKEIKHKDGKMYKQYIRMQQRCRDVWQIPIINAMSKERTGYPTQKPLALLDRIIKASSKEGDLVLDPFCGCATTCVASEKLKRKWIGIDIEAKAVEVLIDRLEKDGNINDGLKFKEQGVDFIHRTDIPQRTDVEIEVISKNVKERLFKTQKGHCNACDNEMRIVDFEVDHIIPKAKGGGDYYENYQLLCSNCNRVKGARPMEYLRA
ncbi:MAG: DNA modification methylase, partial [Candidatus Deianiraeaceae bacterium]